MTQVYDICHVATIQPFTFTNLYVTTSIVTYSITCTHIEGVDSFRCKNFDFLTKDDSS